jgi:23S rRNA (adenine2503-C2)-methyltransferase
MVYILVFFSACTDVGHFWFSYRRDLSTLLLTGKGVTFLIMPQETDLNIKAFTREELQARLGELGLKNYRADQILSWIYAKHVFSFEEMSNISKAERLRLSTVFRISRLKIIRTEASKDGTRKFLFELEDGHTVESVLIPDEERQTLCISSQVGCRQACRFCLTGSGGFARDLKVHEISDQVLEVRRILKEAGARNITNIVFMGMGEPLANFDEVVRALKVITGEKGLAFSPRRVTVSTSGLAPKIDRLAAAGIMVNLAVSLNAATDEVRSRIMPVNRRYPIRELLGACRRFPLQPGRRITFEYVLLKNVNDSAEDARRLARLLKDMRGKVNLIPFNPFPGSEFSRPSDAAILRFQKILLDRKFITPIRESRGRDISAACGQLRERERTRS